MVMLRLLVLFFFVVLTGACRSTKVQHTSDTFANPLLPSGADPYSFFRDGYYYYTHTVGTKLVLWKTKSIATLRDAKQKTVWVPPSQKMYSKQLWAPEILHLRGKWYMYFAADDGNNHNHRMYVIENASADPMKGKWTFKGKVADITDKWAIDGDVFENDGELYMAWSGWEGDENGQQNIYIARMSNPWTIESERVKISSPEYDWEKHGYLKGEIPEYVYVNEGPQFLKHGNKIFIVYSASGCWTDNYTLGMLSINLGKDLLNAANWKKYSLPVFQSNPKENVYAAGHNSFFKSPDGKENWILYHANSAPNQGCGGHRSPRAQKFLWDKNGVPFFGKAAGTDAKLKMPSQ